MLLRPLVLPFKYTDSRNLTVFTKQPNYVVYISRGPFSRLLCTFSLIKSHITGVLYPVSLAEPLKGDNSDILSAWSIEIEEIISNFVEFVFYVATLDTTRN